MPWDATGRWIPEDDSVIPRLTGLLASDSKYIQTARAAGTRTAQRRGLLNSSIAAGAAESAAIAAGAPLASQDAQQVAQKNQAVLEGGINLTNQKEIQAADFAGRSGLLGQEAGFTRERDLLLQQGATEQQIREFDQRTKEQTANLSSSERVALLGSDTDLRQTQIAANSQLSGNYLSAFSTLAGDPNIPADVRNAYITEFQRVLTQGQTLIKAIEPKQLDWGTAPTAPQPAPNMDLNTALPPTIDYSGLTFDPVRGGFINPAIV